MYENITGDWTILQFFPDGCLCIWSSHSFASLLSVFLQRWGGLHAVLSLWTVCLYAAVSRSEEPEGGFEALVGGLFTSLSTLLLSAHLTGHPQDAFLKESPTYAVSASGRPTAHRSGASLTRERWRRTRQVQLTAVLFWSSAHCQRIRRF